MVKTEMKVSSDFTAKRRVVENLDVGCTYFMDSE
jgi:hypothetical protein